MKYTELISSLEWDHFKIGIKEEYEIKELIQIPEKFSCLRHMESLTVERGSSDYSLSGLIKLSWDNELLKLMEYVRNRVYPKKINHLLLSFKSNDNSIISISFTIGDMSLFLTDAVYLSISIDWINVVYNDEFAWEKEFYVNSPTIRHNGGRDFEIEIVIKDKFKNKDAEHSHSISYEWAPHSHFGQGSVITVEDTDLMIADVNGDLTDLTIPCLSILLFVPNGLNDEKMKRIMELFSFLAGRRLCKVGKTRFNKGGRTSSYYSVAPIWYYHAIRQRFTPPIVNSNINCIFPYLQKMLDGFLAIYDEFNLGIALNYYWDAATQAMDTSSVEYHQVVEFLINSFYESHEQEKYYMDPEEFNKLCSVEVKSLIKLLKKSEKGKQIVNKVNELNIKSAGRRTKDITEKFGVALTDEEKELRDKVNGLRHPGDGKIDADEMLRINMFYITYVNRLILGIIGATEYGYLDHTTGKHIASSNQNEN